MKKILLLLFITFQSLIGLAQSVQNDPSKNEWTSYFYARLGQIQTKLYNLALQGKVKAYISDSLVTHYSIEDLNYRGSNKSSKYRTGFDDNPTEQFKPFDPSNLQGIWFLQKKNESAFDIHQQASLIGIGLIYQPSYHGILAMPHPIFHIAIADLKAKLTADELSFLLLLNHYSFNSNSLFESPHFPGDLSDEFLYHNLVRHSYNMADSGFMDKIINMCFQTQPFLSDYFNGNQNIRIIHDHQTKRLISLSELNTKYYTPVQTQIVTGVKDNKEILKDTVMKEPVYLFRECKIETDNGQPVQFIYTPHYSPADIKFSISILSLKDNKIAPAYIWFLEDYFRWK